MFSHQAVYGQFQSVWGAIKSVCVCFYAPSVPVVICSLRERLRGLVVLVHYRLEFGYDGWRSWLQSVFWEPHDPEHKSKQRGFSSGPQRRSSFLFCIWKLHGVCVNLRHQQRQIAAGYYLYLETVECCRLQAETELKHKCEVARFVQDVWLTL